MVTWSPRFSSRVEKVPGVLRVTLEPTAANHPPSKCRHLLPRLLLIGQEVQHGDE